MFFSFRAGNEEKSPTPKSDEPDFTVSKVTPKQKKDIEETVNQEKTLTLKMTDDNNTLEISSKIKLNAVKAADIYLALTTITEADNIKVSGKIIPLLGDFVEQNKSTTTLETLQKMSICNQILNIIDPKRTDQSENLLSTNSPRSP